MCTNFQISEIKVAILEQDVALQDALTKSDYKTASAINDETTLLKNTLREMKEQFAQIGEPKEPRDEKDIICHCLDVLNSYLEHTNISKLTDSLKTCLIEFVLPLEKSKNINIFKKYLKCMFLCAVIDKNVVINQIDDLCIPVSFFLF